MNYGREKQVLSTRRGAIILVSHIVQVVILSLMTIQVQRFLKGNFCHNFTIFLLQPVIRVPHYRDDKDLGKTYNGRLLRGRLILLTNLAAVTVFAFHFFRKKMIPQYIVQRDRKTFLRIHGRRVRCRCGLRDVYFQVVDQACCLKLISTCCLKLISTPGTLRVLLQGSSEDFGGTVYRITYGRIDAYVTICLHDGIN